MTDPIGKVRGGAVPGAEELAPSGGDAFRATLDASRGVDAAKPVGGAAASDVASLAASLEAGRLTPSAVVDQLVARALDAKEARALSDVGRAELERTLRAALAHDPTLLSLQAELERR